MQNVVEQVNQLNGAASTNFLFPGSAGGEEVGWRVCAPAVAGSLELV